MTSHDKAVAEIRAHLHAGEQIIASVRATISPPGQTSGTIAGALVLTNERIVFHGTYVIRKVDHSMSLDTVTSVDSSRAFVGHVTVYAAGGTQRYLVNGRAGQDWATRASEVLAYSRSQHRQAQAPIHPQGPPAGWYGDPNGQPVQRWWDGTRWTEHVQR